MPYASWAHQSDSANALGGYAVNLPFPDNDRPGVIAARAVGRLLVEHGIVPPDLRVERPTLEDVFLRLTGHSMRD